jgi:hypothetical protein
MHQQSVSEEKRLAQDLVFRGLLGKPLVTILEVPSAYILKTRVRNGRT